MEKFELSIPYATVSKRLATTFSIACGVIGLSVVCLVIWLAITIFTPIILFKLGWAGPLLLIWFIYLIYLLFVFVASQIMMATKQPRFIFVSREGIGLPQQWLGLGQPKWYPWSKIRNLQIEQHTNGDVLILARKNNLPIRLALAPLPKAALEKLLLGIEVWGKGVIWQLALIDYRDRLQNENRGIEGISYTQLWYEELASHFSPATFIPLVPGRSLRSGTLEIKRQLAFGGFAAIYLAEDSSLGAVVVKELIVPLDITDAAQKKSVELFEREARLLSKLKYHRIVNVLDHFFEDGRHYIVLERIEGENLRQLVLRKKALTENQVLVLAIQMAETLCYLHKLTPPVIHKDFTPDNLLLKKDGQLIVVDFGAANEFLSNATGTLVGKQCYMPPEQIKGKTQPASDIFAMGCTLYFLLTGQDPKALTTSSPRHVMRNISTEFDQLVTRMTSLDLNERQIDANRVLAELKLIIKARGCLITTTPSINVGGE